MMKNRDHFTEALGFVSREAQHNVVDALACTFHNAAGELGGNTAASDVEWLARLLYEEQGIRPTWNNLPDEEKEFCRMLARTCVKHLPALMERMEARYRAYSKTLRTLERELRAAKNEG